MDETKKSSMASLTSEELIRRLRKTDKNDRLSSDVVALQEEIVRRNVGLVKSIAVRFVHSGEPLDDLIQAGYIGLLNAAANFDLAKETRFSTYATHLIRGEIRHHIRDKHTTIRIPQWVQTMNRRIKEAEEALFQEEGRPPTLGELGRRLDLTAQQVAALLRGRESMMYVSIDQERRVSDPNPGLPTIERLMPRHDGLPHDVGMRILIAIERLTEIQQQVIEGLFYQGKSQSEVGDELGISQRQVSRIKDRILSEMREDLEGRDEPTN
ncbi:sigma-70 family RNA polymerase sigma factor [Candidatus Bipolaricaulota bacterium]